LVLTHYFILYTLFYYYFLYTHAHAHAISPVSLLQDIARSSGSFPESRSLAGLFLEIPALKANKNKMKLAMQFATSAAADFATRGMDALALVSPFDEVALLTEQREYLTRGMDLGGLEIVSVNLEDETVRRCGGWSGVF
jgi:hypothetical protein